MELHLNPFKGNKVKINTCPVCLLGKYKSLLENAFGTLIRYLLRYHPSKLELEAFAGTIVAVTPTSGPNIYITRSAKRTCEICGRHDKRSKIICGAVPNVMLALYITSPSGPAGGLF